MCPLSLGSRSCPQCLATVPACLLLTHSDSFLTPFIFPGGGTEAQDDRTEGHRQYSNVSSLHLVSQEGCCHLLVAELQPEAECPHSVVLFPPRAPPPHAQLTAPPVCLSMCPAGQLWGQAMEQALVCPGGPLPLLLQR